MIQKIILFIFIGFCSFAYAKVDVVVSILPQETFVKAIGANKVNITVMVQPGNSPHTYEPKPSQMKDISKADIYLSIGVEFEHNWLPKFINQNKNMRVIDISNGIVRLPMINHKTQHQSLDPHVWVTPSNVKIIAKNILESLITIDKINKDYYTNNYNKFIELLINTDKNIKNILKDTPKKTKFIVFHPSWGSFAKEYDLVQIPIETEGKEPKPKEIIKLIKKAKRYNVKAILTAPEFSQKVAKHIASQLNINVIQISPLSPKWDKNLKKLANAIANK